MYHVISLPHALSVRLRGWVLLEEARGRRCQTDCVPAAAPSLGGDTARWCAGCESGRAAGRPGWTEPATEQSRTTETPEDAGTDLLRLQSHLQNENIRMNWRALCTLSKGYECVCVCRLWMWTPSFFARARQIAASMEKKRQKDDEMRSTRLWRLL